VAVAEADARGVAVGVTLPTLGVKVAEGVGLGDESMVGVVVGEAVGVSAATISGANVSTVTAATRNT